ncbi:hypothetical protein ACJQWK_00238 [Exserohilum turcicum]
MEQELCRRSRALTRLQGYLCKGCLGPNGTIHPISLVPSTQTSFPGCTAAVIGLDARLHAMAFRPSMSTPLLDLKHAPRITEVDANRLRELLRPFSFRSSLPPSLVVFPGVYVFKPIVTVLCVCLFAHVLSFSTIVLLVWTYFLPRPAIRLHYIQDQKSYTTNHDKHCPFAPLPGPEQATPVRLPPILSSIDSTPGSTHRLLGRQHLPP